MLRVGGYIRGFGLPIHDDPFPVYPDLQEQLNPPMLFTQLAFLSQL